MFDAHRNDEIISIADSQMFRWIDELNGITDADERAKEIKHNIKIAKRGENTPENRKNIKKLYAELDALQFKPDYMCLIIDKKKDYYRACKGFSINGIEYKRLLGTNGGIKNSTIVFVSERLHNELNRRVENDRDISKKMVTAKLESYRALTCSASTPVSAPKGILVVDDVETTFKTDSLFITNEFTDEPTITPKYDEEITMDASDGYGLMLPSLAERWSGELGLDYTVSGVNTRFSFEKGILVTFDFLDFAERIAGTYVVKDAWGDYVDVRDVEAIFTTSMIKLWDSYKSCSDYLEKSYSNGYAFGISKTAPKELEEERHTNYQFLQSYRLTDEELDELVSPTINEIKDTLDGDWRKAVLFLKGDGLNESSVKSLPDDFIKAMMIDDRIFDDSFVKTSIHQMIKKKITDAKVGVLKVHGNYSIICGDPYLLCQSIFGLELTGLLKAGEIYSSYWAWSDAEKLACYRAPMTSMNNIRIVTPARNDDVYYWYQYINTMTVFNGWDTTCAALNGCDFDGDIVMLTDNDILVGKHRDLPVLMCMQRVAEKSIPSEDDFIESNIKSFGNDIGRTTNWITSMFEVQSNFEEDSEEYKTLEYRIMCGQLFQQDCIDRTKGIICKPMPEYWHDSYRMREIADKTQRNFCRNIVADKKPYFMKYIYPSLAKQYNTYMENVKRNSMKRFGVELETLLEIPESELTSDQKNFIRYYKIKMPLGRGKCITNKICERIENEFDSRHSRYSSPRKFDYRIMKTDTPYLSWQYNKIKKLYEAYNKRVENYSIYASYERMEPNEAKELFAVLDEDFKEECLVICPSEEVLCNIILDICYSKASTKRFAWNMCGEQIIKNLLARNENTISYPYKDRHGDIEHRGKRYSLAITKIEED